MALTGRAFKAVNTFPMPDGLGITFGKILRRGGSGMTHEGSSHAFHLFCAIAFLQGLNQNISDGF
jgi:hypothetical protein